MTYDTATCCLLSLCIAAGCDTVTVTQPIGNPEAIVEVRKLQGVWLNDDRESFELRVLRDGDVMLGVLKWDTQAGSFRADNKKLIMTQANNLRFLHMTDADDSRNGEYPFCRYEYADENTILLYYPVASRFEDAVQSGTLDGVVTKRERSKSTRLNTDSERLAEFLAQRDGRTYFEKEPTQTLSLVKKTE